MRKLASVQRMAKKVLRCGQSKLWFDPNEYESVLAADSIEKVKNLIEDGTIIKKNDKVNSRANARDRKEAKSKGRHMGNGSRKGTKNARLPKKTIWIKTLRSMRSILRDMKNKGELTSEEYQKYRRQAKGNMFKLNKNTMIEHINRKKQEAIRLAELELQAAALKMGQNN